MPVVSQPIWDSLYLADSAGTAITGADTGDFTATATLLGSATTAAVTVSEESGGWYHTSFTPTAAGRWRLVVTYDDGTTQRIFTGTEDVTAADITSASAVAAAVVAALPARQVVTVAAPVATDGTITIVKGDTPTLTFTNSGWNLAADAAIELVATYAGASTTFTGERVSATSVSVPLTEDDTLALTSGRLVYRYALRDTSADQTLATGNITVRS